MRCNTPLMNSWHSFSPNGRWLVFSSKSRSPYTQMFLTHLDEEGNDSPAILIENATAANRAVNIPEFVNIPPEGLAKIDVPAAEYYQRYDEAIELAAKGRDEAAIATWERALVLNSEDARAYNNLGALLLRDRKVDQATANLERAVQMDPAYGAAHNNLGAALLEHRRYAEAVVHFEKALSSNPRYPGIHNNLGGRSPRAASSTKLWRTGARPLKSIVTSLRRTPISAMRSTWQETHSRPSANGGEPCNRSRMI